MATSQNTPGSLSGASFLPAHPAGSGSRPGRPCRSGRATRGAGPRPGAGGASPGRWSRTRWRPSGCRGAGRSPPGGGRRSGRRPGRSPKFSRAMRAVRMLELSPLVTAATAPACSMPASIEVVAIEAEADDLLPGEVVGQALAEGVGVLVDDGDRVAVALEAHGELAAHPPTPDDDDMHRVSLQRRRPEQAIEQLPGVAIGERRMTCDRRIGVRHAPDGTLSGGRWFAWGSEESGDCGVRQASPGRSAAGHDRDGTPADPEDHRARGLLLRRHLVDRVRDRGDPLRRRGRRVEPGARSQQAGADRRSRSRSCSRSSSRRTARRSSPTRAVAAATSSAARTSARTRR